MRTRVKSPGQNGSRERGFGTLKYERLFIDEIDDAVMLAKHAEEYRIEYNTVRPHEAIAWNRPQEVHLGLADPTTQLLDAGQRRASASAPLADLARNATSLTSPTPIAAASLSSALRRHAAASFTLMPSLSATTCRAISSRRVAEMSRCSSGSITAAATARARTQSGWSHGCGGGSDHAASTRIASVSSSRSRAFFTARAPASMSLPQSRVSSRSMVPRRCRNP
ncbi:MAG: integrase core domain-containing protein [Natronosporangium sp.]